MQGTYQLRFNLVSKLVSPLRYFVPSMRMSELLWGWGASEQAHEVKAIFSGALGAIDGNLK